jgi:hypothetical protein
MYSLSLKRGEAIFLRGHFLLNVYAPKLNS